MLILNSIYSGKSIGYYLCAAILVIALKQFYSVANAAQLQWILYPLVLLLELFSDLSFVVTADFEWVDNERRISIVKSCAGLNFMIISLLAYLWLWRDKSFGMQLVVRALISAWLIALLANTLRILLCIYTQETLAGYIGLSEEGSHRFIGIAVYFLSLWGLLSAFRLRDLRRTAMPTMLLYLSITLLIPLLRAWVLDMDLPSGNYIVWVAGFPALMVLLALATKQSRWINFEFL